MRTFLPRTIRPAGLLLLAMLAAILCGGCGRWGPAPQQGPGVGSPLGELRLQPLTGEARPLSLADLRGSVVLLNFWGTWCEPCRLELPHIAQIYKAHQADADFKLLAVSCGGPGKRENRRLAERYRRVAQENAHHHADLRGSGRSDPDCGRSRRQIQWLSHHVGAGSAGDHSRYMARL